MQKLSLSVWMRHSGLLCKFICHSIKQINLMMCGRYGEAVVRPSTSGPGPFWVEFARSGWTLHVLPVFLWVRSGKKLPPLVQRHASGFRLIVGNLTNWSFQIGKWMFFVCLCQTCDELATCPGCALPCPNVGPPPPLPRSRTKQLIFILSRLL